MGKSKVRRGCSFFVCLLSSLNMILFILSAASFVPTIILKKPPTSFGIALLIVSGISLVSSFVGFYHLTSCCYHTHVSLLLASLVGQALAILSLFTKEKASMEMLKSQRDPKEAKLLMRAECGAFMAMFVLQCVVLILSCAVHTCGRKDYEELEAEKAEAAERKQKKTSSKKIPEVKKESTENATKIADIKAKYGRAAGEP